MARIQPIDPDTADPKSLALLEGIQKSLGVTPNVLATLAHAPAALQAHVSFTRALGTSSINQALREQIALAVAGENGCDYCSSAHTAMGGGLGLESDELDANLRSESSDPTVAAALQFARRLLETRGRVDDEDLQAVREAGYGDREIAEILAIVVFNIFTNYFANLAEVEIDFPFVASRPTAAA